MGAAIYTNRWERWELGDEPANYIFAAIFPCCLQPRTVFYSQALTQRILCSILVSDDHASSLSHLTPTYGFSLAGSQPASGTAPVAGPAGGQTGLGRTASRYATVASRGSRAPRPPSAQDAVSRTSSANSTSARQLRRASSLTDLVPFSSLEPTSPRRAAGPLDGAVITPEPYENSSPEGDEDEILPTTPVGLPATVPRRRTTPMETQHAMPEWHDPATEERSEAARQFR